MAISSKTVKETLAIDGGRKDVKNRDLPQSITTTTKTVDKKRTIAAQLSFIDCGKKYVGGETEIVSDKYLPVEQKTTNDGENRTIKPPTTNCSQCG